MEGSGKMDEGRKWVEACQRQSLRLLTSDISTVGHYLHENDDISLIDHFVHLTLSIL